MNSCAAASPSQSALLTTAGASLVELTKSRVAANFIANAIMHHKFSCAWKSASHIERAPQREKKPPWGGVAAPVSPS